MPTDIMDQKHGHATRLLHAGLALAVLTQLASSQFMQTPRPNRAANWVFIVHEYAGLAAFGLAAGFWVVLILRRRGTAPGLLVPWLSATRRRALWSDNKAHFQALKALRFPLYTNHSPLASAVHGLGLLLMGGMAATGTLYYLTATADGKASATVHLLMEVHALLGNVVWAYLIGHAAMAIIHHYTQHLNLREMWSLRRANTTEGARK